MHTAARHWCRRGLDATVAIAVAVLSLIAAGLAQPSLRALDWRGEALLVIGSTALFWRRQHPVAVLVASAVCVLTYHAVGFPGLLTTLPVLVSVYTAVLAGHGKVTFLVMTVGLASVGAAVSGVSSLERSTRELAEAKFLMVGWMLAGGAMATVSRQRSAYIAEVEQRAIEAEHTREETARRRATEERLRIARDLHDSLTHNISTIKVQAGVALHLARKRGEEIPAALVAIEEASAEAMRELRSTLSVLRQSPTDDGETEAVSGLHRLAHLIERARSAGVPATVTVTGHERPLPPEVDQAAYRVVQEALTNVSRHACGATAAVRLRYGGEELAVAIDDDGRGCPDGPPIPGVGLIGMRERVAALGGRVSAGPRREGGFSVHAAFPLHALAREPVVSATA